MCLSLARHLKGFCGDVSIIVICHFLFWKCIVKQFVFVRDPLSLHIGDETICPCHMEITWTKPSRTSLVFRVSIP